jgi:membrane fusion protein, multidrug efflux system
MDSLPPPDAPQGRVPQPHPDTTLPGTGRTGARRGGMRRAVFLLLCLAAVGGVVWLVHLRRENTGADAAQALRNVPIPVLAATAHTQDVLVWLDGLGTVQAYNTVTVHSMIDGPLTAVDFAEGQDVKAGAILATIDKRPYQAALDQAIAKLAQDQANLANARVDMARFDRLIKENSTSDQQAATQRATVAQLVAQVQQDQAAIETARTNFSYTDITSPISGRTGIRQVDAGNIVHASDTNGVVVITQLQPISVVFTLPQQVLGQVSAAMQQGPVEALALPQLAGGTSGATPLDTGRVAVLDNQVDNTTGTLKLKATFPNPHLALWPGGFVNVRVKVQTLHDMLTVPPVAVQRGPTGAYVYVVADGKAHRQAVTLGLQTDQVAVIIGGLRDGDQVVTDGGSRLNDGSPVRVAQPDSNAPTGSAPRAPDRVTAPGAGRRGPDNS